MAEPTRSSWVAVALALVVAAPATGLSFLVTGRPDGAVVGVLLGVLALAVAHVVAKETWLEWLAADGDPRRWAWLVAVTAENAWWVLAAFGLLLLYFPDGRLPSPRWRLVPAALVVCTAATQAYGAVEDAPFRPPLEDLRAPVRTPPAVARDRRPLFFPMLSLFLACTASLVLRYRRADAVQRQQIKWLALAGVGMPLYPLLCLLEILIWGQPFWVSAAIGVASLVATPVAAGHRGAAPRPVRRRQGARPRRHLGRC